MPGFFFILLGALLGLAGITREPFLFTLIYLLAGVFLLGQWWNQRAIEALPFQHTFSQRVFPGEPVDVQLTIQNKGWLPLVWLRIQELLPHELTCSSSYQQVISLELRQRVLSFYSNLTHRGEQVGMPRRGSQAPSAYGQSLGEIYPDVQKEINEKAQAFNEARYSRHPITPDQAHGIQSFWKRVLQALRRVPINYEFIELNSPVSSAVKLCAVGASNDAQTHKPPATYPG